MAPRNRCRLHRSTASSTNRGKHSESDDKQREPQQWHRIAIYIYIYLGLHKQVIQTDIYMGTKNAFEGGKGMARGRLTRQASQGVRVEVRVEGMLRLCNANAVLHANPLGAFASVEQKPACEV